MQIAIDISDEDYERLKVYEKAPFCSLTSRVYEAIANGVLIPKGCGDLIDRKPIYDSLIRSYRADKKDYPERGKEYRVGLSNAIDLLNAAPTIIEADKEDKDGLDI